MKNKTLILLFAFFFCNFISAQTSAKSVLFTVDNDPVYVDDFKRVYNKNLDLVKDESQKDVDTYLDLFIKYKLKLKEARALGLDQKPKYKSEFANYRKQLAKNYLTDSEVTDALIEEAFDRVLHEVKASHILVRVAETAEPQDTLAAYNKLIEAREKVNNGEDFAAIAKRYSEDPSAAENGGDLGYFGGFRMVYDFENAAYNTKIGDVSKPFRTRFGYHIVTVNDKRKSLGQVTIAHIMVANKKEQDSTKEDPETRIKNIYQKLQQGEKFESLAKQFSEDKASAKKGGLLNKFGKGQLSSAQFEDAAFGLKEKGEITPPIKTDYGWHIIKLIEKHPVRSIDEMRNELEVKIKRDSRSKLINSAFADKLKEKYGLSNTIVSPEYFAGLLNDDFYKRSWKIPETLDTSKTLFKIDGKDFTYGDFANHLLNSQRNLKVKQPFEKIIKDNYQEFLNASVLRYYEDNLENENKEFAIVVNEYRDGLLLFDLMESEVWNAAKKDTVALKDYFNNNREAYKWNKRIDATVASASKKDIVKKTAKYFSKGWNDNEIKEKLNKSDKLNVIFTKDTMDITHQALPKDFEFNTGVSKVYKHNDAYVVIKVDEVIDSSLKTFEEAKGKVISDYQTYIENNWLNTLKNKYQVNVDADVLAEIKKEINK